MLGSTPNVVIGPSGLPTVNDSNLPPNGIQNLGNPQLGFPPPPPAPFPSLQQPLGPMNGFGPNNYGPPQGFPPFNQLPPNFVQNLAQTMQNETNQRRIGQLEDETALRRKTTLTLQQMGTHLLQSQMDAQEQILQYQFMIERCMESLDHQNYVLNGQAEELALLRAKMRNFEYLIDAFKQSKDNQLLRSPSDASNLIDNNLFCFRNSSLLQSPSNSPFFNNGVTRVTSSKFQPFNPRYRSPNSRSSNPTGPRSATPSVPNPTPANTRPSRPISNTNN